MAAEIKPLTLESGIAASYGAGEVYQSFMNDLDQETREQISFDQFAIGYLAAKRSERFKYKDKQKVVVQAGAISENGNIRYEDSIGTVWVRNNTEQGIEYLVRFDGESQAHWYRECYLQVASRREIAHYKYEQEKKKKVDVKS